MIRHLAGSGEVVEDVDAAVRFYRDVLGLEVEYEAESDYATVMIPGSLHYGLWSRRAAAESIFGDPGRSADVPLGMLYGFEVDDVDAAYARLVDAGATVVQEPKTEPWGQKTARFLLPSGVIAEVAETPWARTLVTNVSAQPAGEP